MNAGADTVDTRDGGKRVEPRGAREEDVTGDLATGDGAGQVPWIETTPGGWFFVNALLVAPELVVLFPLLAGRVVSFLAPGREPSPFLDTIPSLASHALPLVGWVLVIPIWTTVKNLRMKLPLSARLSLVLFLVLHLVFLGYTVGRWLG